MSDTRNFYGNAAGCRLFLNEQDSDVSICVQWDGNPWNFPAHRLVLSAMSEVFRVMFSTDMEEKTIGKITIKDSSPLTVKQFLKYLYMGVMDFNGWQEAVDLLRIAHKYEVYTLLNLCETHLLTVISYSNCCFLNDLAQTYSLKSLRRESANFILDAAFIVTSTEGFFSMTQKSVEYFLSSSRLNIENECCVLSAIREWGTVECCRRGISLTKSNILSVMEPLMKCIKWNLVPEELRTYVPKALVDKYMGQATGRRKLFYVPAILQYHISILKFMVELGAYFEGRNCESGLNCLKFGVDNHCFVAGFKIMGMFKISLLNSWGPSSLTLGRDDNKAYTQFNLNSLPWTKGASVDEYIWREMLAYLPYPVRLSPFSTYAVTLKYPNIGNSIIAKWPSTSLECGLVKSDLGPIGFNSYSTCYGLTQLFLLPAPPIRNVCSDTN